MSYSSASDVIRMDARQRLTLVLAAVGLALPVAIVLVKPDDYGLIQPATPRLLSQQLALLLAQAFFWLALPLNAFVALCAIWLQISRRRLSASMCSALASSAALVYAWFWLMFTDFD